MKIFSKQYEWLRLIDVSGPFLSATALDAAFPSGLDALDKRVKRELAHYYDEWQTAQDRSSSDFPALHKAWCEAVLCTGLGFRDKYLFPGEGWSVNGEGGLGAFSPDRALKIFDDKVDLFVKFLPPDVQPNGRNTSDEWKDTFVEKMTRLCRSHGTRLGLVTNGEQWVLVNATQGGALSGSATWYARLWFQEDSTLRAFVALLGFDRFTGALDKTLPRLLDESLEHLDEVTDTLGKQVMTAVEVLLEGLDRADLDSGRALLRDVPPNVLYEASLTVMMRLVFILSAEERGLLLLGEPAYDDAYAVSTLRGKLESDRDKFGDQVLERRFDAWVRLLSLFRAIYSGIDHPLLRMPAMGGSLFDPDKYPFLEGRSRDVSWDIENPPPLPIDNRTVLLLLESLQVLKAKDGAIPLSFRSLDVEQIGYVYEGLLEATGAQAGETMLGLKGDKSHHNPEIALSELEMLKMESEEKLFARMKEVTGRSAIANEYADPPDMTTLPFLGKACRGDEELKNRILPFFNWLRLSEWGEPVVYHKDSFYVTEGADRRATGTHYTPKQLTEMMVKEALEPVVYIGPAEGLPRAEWKLKSPAEILDLKVCDPAMGSGAFLVQACRYLGDRLVDAWEQAESEGRVINANGAVTDFPPDEPMSKVQEDRLVEARRLVAERCLYGVDINPLAVELAKLSLWLVTISKGRPFGFLDHNLKSGDSLLGVSDIEQLVQFRMKPEPGDPGNLMSEQIRNAVEDAKKERRELRETRIRDIRDIRVQMQHLEKAEAAIFRLKEYADYFIGTVLTSGKPSKKTFKEWDAAAMQGYSLLNPATDSFASAQEKKRTIVMLSHDLPVGKTQARRPFHWAIEFPEVFAQGGFNAIVGNPPFMGGKHITGNFGIIYRDYLVHNIAGSNTGCSDYVAYFYLRAFDLLRREGLFALIANNTIAEGPTRKVGLERILGMNGVIVEAHPNMPWPGSAGVVISPVTIFKGCEYHGKRLLGESEVDTISAYLSAQEEFSPLPLRANKGRSFIGSVVIGKGFILTEVEACQLLKQKDNQIVVVPYLNGDDVNTSPTQAPSRWIINFYDWPRERTLDGCWESLDIDSQKRAIADGVVTRDYPGKVAADYQELFSIVESKVRPQRELVKRDVYRKMWWQFAEKCAALYYAVGRGRQFVRHADDWANVPYLESVLVCARVSKYFVPVLVPNSPVFQEKVVVLVDSTFDRFAFMSSSLLQDWVWTRSSTLGTTLNFSPSESYESIPFLDNYMGLEALGKIFDAHRRKIMLARQIGLTALYNLFHNPGETDAELEEMRHLQREIDIAVRDSYGWQDIDLEHGFHEVGYLPANDNVRYTISEPARIKILKRLAKLNKERWEEEEAAGLHKKGRK